MNLKPYRIIEPHNILNGLFALNAESGDKGSLVKILDSGWVNGQPQKAISLTSLANVVSNRYVLPSQIGLAGSGDTSATILGVLLNDVRATNFLGVSYLYDQVRKAEGEIVLSGEAAPVVTKAVLLVNANWGTGASQGGTPAVNYGAVAHDTVAGGWKVVAGSTAGSIGKFLGSADVDGYALFKLDL